MTNHPHRQRGEDAAPDSDPPVTEMPPGFSLNGGRTPMAALAGQLPQMLFQAMSAALRQVPAKQLPCAQCYLEQLKWGAVHAADVARAEEAFQAAAAEVAQRAPEDRVPLDGLGFLPERLRPGSPGGPPAIAEGAVMVSGTLLCAGHIPGAPGRPGQSPLLIAQGALPDGTLAQFLRGLAA